MRMAVTIAAALFAVVAAPALAQNSESAPAAAAPMKSKPKTPAGGTVTVKVTNWREADLVELQVVAQISILDTSADLPSAYFPRRST
ncbi:MAG: hypothetical protein WA397_20505 [Roseiarcus sp.]